MFLIDTQQVLVYDDDAAFDPTVTNAPMVGVETGHGLTMALPQDVFSRARLLEEYEHLLKCLIQEPDFVDLKISVGYPLVMIAVDDKIVGSFAENIAVIDGVTYYRDSLPYIHPEFRNKGYYSQAMEFWYRNRRPSIAHVFDRNLASIRMYEKIGFVKDRAEPIDGEPASIYLLK